MSTQTKIVDASIRSTRSYTKFYGIFTLLLSIMTVLLFVLFCSVPEPDDFPFALFLVAMTALAMIVACWSFNTFLDSLLDHRQLVAEKYANR